MIKNTKDMTNHRVVGMIVGPSGIGKTSLADTLNGKTLIASAESGLLCLAGKDHDYVEIKTMQDLKNFFILCMKEETKNTYQNIYIDSLTEIGDKLLLELKASDEYKDAKMALKMYGQYNDDFTKFVKALRDMKPYNVWFTCLNEYEKDGIELVEGFNFPGAKVKANVKGWFDIVLKYEVFEHEGVKIRKLITDMEVNRLAKDRSGKLSKYEDANLGNIMNKIMGAN
jgi:phage nucleotide-binding protein